MSNLEALKELLLNKSKIQFESNSQPMPIELEGGSHCCLISQRYNLKAIHNSM